MTKEKKEEPTSEDSNQKIIPSTFDPSGTTFTPGKSNPPPELTKYIDEKEERIKAKIPHFSSTAIPKIPLPVPGNQHFVALEKDGTRITFASDYDPHGLNPKNKIVDESELEQKK